MLSYFLSVSSLTFASLSLLYQNDIGKKKKLNQYVCNIVETE